MATHVAGQKSVDADQPTQVPTLHLGTLRRNILAVLSADVFTPAERLRANQAVYACEDGTRLTLWLKNVRRVRTEREAALALPGNLRLTDTTWNLRCANLAEKRELLAYAASQGVACGLQVDENDLGLGWNERQGKLYSFPVEWAGQAVAGRNCELITAAQFRALVQAGAQCATVPVQYATAAQTSEIHQLALHRFLTTGERAKAMRTLPTLTTVQATLVIGELWAKVLHRTEMQASTTAPVLLPRYSQEARRNRQQAYLLELRATLPHAIAAYDRVVAGWAVLTQDAPTYYLERVAEGWDLDEQGSLLNTAALLLGFADLAEARQQLPLVAAALPALGAPTEVSYAQAC